MSPPASTSTRRRSMDLRVPLVLLGLAACTSGPDPDPFALTFEPGDPSSELRPFFSPKGTRIPLTPAEGQELGARDALAGSIELGPSTRSCALLLERSGEGAYDRLRLDTDCDGDLLDESPLHADVSVKRGATWSTFDAVFRVTHGPDGDRAQAYPVHLWVVVDEAAAAPDVLRYTRRGFLVARTELDGTGVIVLVTDGDNDAILGEAADSWAIAREGTARPFAFENSRALDDFAWAEGRAFRLRLEGTAGRRGHLVPHDPGVTPEEDASRRDVYRRDREAPRATRPLRFRADADVVLAAPAPGRGPVFLVFTAEWCGPCHLMDELVYASAAVVEAAAGLTCVKVDGDERADLKERFHVGGYPTGILLDETGAELSRFSGYRGVHATAAFLGAARPR